MSLGWVIAGTIGQLCLAVFLWMVVIFSSAGIVNGHTLDKFQSGILDVSMFALPSVCVISAGIVLYLFHSDAGAAAYWWYAAPFATAALYLIYAVSLNQ